MIQMQDFTALEEKMSAKSDILEDMSDDNLWEKEYNSMEDWQYKLESQLKTLNSEYRQNPVPEKKAEVFETYHEWKSVKATLELGEIDIDYLKEERSGIEDELEELITEALTDAIVFVEENSIECDEMWLEEMYESVMRSTFEARECYYRLDNHDEENLFEYCLNYVTEDSIYPQPQQQTSIEVLQGHYTVERKVS